MPAMSDFSCNVKENIKRLETSLNVERNFDILQREVMIAGHRAGFFFIDGFVQEDMIEKLMQFFYSLKESDMTDIDAFLEKGMPYTEVEKSGNIDSVITQFLSGVSIMTIDGFDECLLIVCYISDSVDRNTLDRMRKLIQSIDVDALTMNIESLAECMFTHKWINPFPKFKYSERPDTATAAILDGNIVIMVDNSPAVMIIPASIFDIIEEADDFNFSPMIGSYLRITRFFFSIITWILTPLWLLFVNNPEWVPEFMKFILITDDITVPVLLQLLILELAVDGLKLAAVNTPTMLSTPLSIVAGIVVGEYAVSSGWFNPEALLYMAVVTVGTYGQTNFEMGYAFKFLRVLLLILTQILNLAGFITGVVISVLMIAFNRTITGKSYIYPLIPWDGKMLKRKVFRVRLPHGFK